MLDKPVGQSIDGAADLKAVNEDFVRMSQLEDSLTVGVNAVSVSYNVLHLPRRQRAKVVVKLRT